MKAKYLAIIAGIVFACIVGGVVAFMYQSEDRVPVEAELAKYPEFSPFLIGKTSFRGIRFNVDTNLYSFAFTTAVDSPDIFFAEVAKALNGSNWKVAASEGTTRVYVRQSPQSLSQGEIERVTLMFNPANREVTFVREGGSSKS